MRWTLWRDRRTRLKRTAKSCGSDASTLASSLSVMIRKMTAARKPDRREEHEGNR
jgi:hypothetical protein